MIVTEFRGLYAPPRELVVVDVPEMQFLMVDGHGDPNTVPEYQEAVEALHAQAFKIKCAGKGQPGKHHESPQCQPRCGC